MRKLNCSPCILLFKYNKHELFNCYFGYFISFLLYFACAYCGISFFGYCYLFEYIQQMWPICPKAQHLKFAGLNLPWGKMTAPPKSIGPGPWYNEPGYYLGLVLYWISGNSKQLFRFSHSPTFSAVLEASFKPSGSLNLILSLIQFLKPWTNACNS